MTSDSGLLLYKEFDNKIGFSQQIKKNLSLNDNVNHRNHENENVILQRIYQNAAGYHADSDANDLRYDNVFQTVLNKDVIDSQPTISRINTKLNKEHMKQLQKANDKILDKIHNFKPPKKMIFDLDSTSFKTYV
mgnify:CR=1 FL=1